MEKDKIYIATFSEGAEEAAERYGFGLELDHLCISENLNEENREKITEEMTKAAAGRSAIVHGPFTELIPCAIDERARNLAMERHMESIEICRELGGKKLILHSGWIPSMYFPSWQVERSVEYWKKLVAKAFAAPENATKTCAAPKNAAKACAAPGEDFTICVENVFEPEPDTLIEIIDGVGDPRLKICLDVGHANAVKTTGTVEEWIEKMGERIGHFHLHNNDGGSDSHGELTDGALDMERILRLAEKRCPDVTYTIESRKCGKSAAWLAARAR